MGVFDDWVEKESSDYILATDYVEQLAVKYDSSIKTTAEYLLHTGFSAFLYFKEPNGDFEKDNTHNYEEDGIDEGPYIFLTHITHNIGDCKSSSFQTDANHLALRYADRYFCKAELPIIRAGNIDSVVQQQDAKLIQELKQAYAKIDMLENSQSDDRFRMGIPVVEGKEPMTSEQIIDNLRGQVRQLTNDNDDLGKQLKKAHIEIEKVKTSQPSDDDKELAPNSEAKVADLIYILLNELKYDLTIGGKGNTNLLIENTSKNLNTPLSPNFIAYWLKKAYQLQIKDLNK